MIIAVRELGIAHQKDSTQLAIDESGFEVLEASEVEAAKFLSSASTADLSREVLTRTLDTKNFTLKEIKSVVEFIDRRLAGASVPGNDFSSEIEKFYCAARQLLQSVLDEVQGGPARAAVPASSPEFSILDAQ